MTRPLPRLVDADREAQAIARINALTAAGRTNWFGLLAYLVFAFITVLGVEDADFFIPSRQTKLPVVGIEIPTEAFFFFAPVLGAALYVYLHLYVRKVTAALCKAPARIKGDGAATSTPLERHITPWLLNDLVLSRRDDEAIDQRPLDRLANATAIALVWLAGPFVLAAMWIRSWPAHNQAITTLAGLCLMLAIYAGHISWIRLKRDLSGDARKSTAGDPQRVAAIAMIGGAVALFGLIKTEIGAPYDKVGRASASLTGSISVFFATIPNMLDPKWWVSLTPARLAEVQFAALPPDQADPAAARAAFRESWCKRHGMDAKTCGPAPAPGRQPFPKADELHDVWCTERGIAAGEACADHLIAMEDAFKTEWQNLREATLAALPKPDLREADLRGADLSNASLTGMILREARLDGANLFEARMEGADLRFAEMAGADLRWAQMAGAVLRFAEMAGADLSSARMEGADLSFAEMARADLSEARMEGADLRGAEMAGADLSEARMAGADLRRAQMAGAVLRFAEMAGADLSSARMEGADLRWARMEGADLTLAWMARADLRWAQMAGADLSSARMEGADLSEARMEGANLSEARMEGANLSWADLRRTNWAGATNDASPAQFADLRGGKALDQSRLMSLIGNAATLLPETPQGQADLFLPSCWTEVPPGLDKLVATAARYDVSEAELRDPDFGYFCAPGNRPVKTGTPWPLDRDPPWVAEGLSKEDWAEREDARRRKDGPFPDPGD